MESWNERFANSKPDRPKPLWNLKRRRQRPPLMLQGDGCTALGSDVFQSLGQSRGRERGVKKTIYLPPSPTQIWYWSWILTRQLHRIHLLRASQVQTGQACRKALLSIQSGEPQAAEPRCRSMGSTLHGVWPITTLVFLDCWKQILPPILQITVARRLCPGASS